MTAKTQSFKRFLSLRVLLVFSLLVPFSSWAQQQFFTDVTLLGGGKSDTETLVSQYRSKGYTIISQDLNAGAAGDYIYLAYKTSTVYNASTFITDFYLKSGSDAPDSFTHNGRTYRIVLYEGSNAFKNSKGDLNRGAGGDYIRLYCTTESFPGSTTVTNVYFNDTQAGALGKDGDNSSGYDLNNGTTGRIIYMHVDKADLLPLDGAGTDRNPYKINSDNDWEIFARRIELGIESSRHYQLTADINITKPVGLTAKPFCGVFNGNGKVINANINNPEAVTAPFREIKGATIKNLTVTGTVTSSAYHASGLVGGCADDKGHPNCIIGCTINATINGTGYTGGLVGHGGNGVLTIQNCVFGGTISGFSAYAGGLVGWCEDLQLNVTNCLFKGSFAPASGGKYHPIVCRYEKKNPEPFVYNAFYLNTAAPSDNLGIYAVPGVTGTAVSQTNVPGSYDCAVDCPDGQTYYMKSSYAGRFNTFCGFENDLEGWTIVDGYNHSAGVYTGIISSEANCGSKCFRFEYRDSKDQYLISPEFNTLSALRMEFFLKGMSDYAVGLQIGYSSSTNDVSAFTWMDAITTQISNWSLVLVDVPVGTKYIAFRYIKSSSYVYIDDITVYAPYPDPYNLTAQDKTDTSITFNWEAPAQETVSYLWKYKKSGTDTWLDSGETTDTTLILTGLTASTEYDFSIQAHYADGRNSNYLTATFSTQKPMAMLPHIQDFEDGMKGWELINCVNGTGITTEASHEGSHSFVFEKGDGYQYLQSPLFEDGRTLDVEFYCKVTDEDHPASFVVASSGANGDNLQTSNLVTIDQTGWVYAPLQLPYGTRYFYIVWISGDKLYIDDISFHDYEYETGIKSIDVDNVYPINFNDSTPIYNLSGQQLQKFQRGINIINGKKILIK